MRNRHVQSTGKENEVLLDENLVQSERDYFFRDFLPLNCVNSCAP